MSPRMRSSSSLSSLSRFSHSRPSAFLVFTCPSSSSAARNQPASSPLCSLAVTLSCLVSEMRGTGSCLWRGEITPHLGQVSVCRFILHEPISRTYFFPPNAPARHARNDGRGRTGKKMRWVKCKHANVHVHTIMRTRSFFFSFFSNADQERGHHGHSSSSNNPLKSGKCMIWECR